MSAMIAVSIVIPLIGIIALIIAIFYWGPC